jgi:hypothetical protein
VSGPRWGGSSPWRCSRSNEGVLAAAMREAHSSPRRWSKRAATTRGQRAGHGRRSCDTEGAAQPPSHANPAEITHVARQACFLLRAPRAPPLHARSPAAPPARPRAWRGRPRRDRLRLCLRRCGIGARGRKRRRRHLGHDDGQQHHQQRDHHRRWQRRKRRPGRRGARAARRARAHGALGARHPHRGPRLRRPDGQPCAPVPGHPARAGQRSLVDQHPSRGDHRGGRPLHRVLRIPCLGPQLACRSRVEARLFRRVRRRRGRRGQPLQPEQAALRSVFKRAEPRPHDAGAAAGKAYKSGPENRADDSALVAPKTIWLGGPGAKPEDVGPRPTRALKDDIVYEVHVRGFTKSDPSVTEACRGTFAGAAEKADYLASLGVTAIELLPVQETSNSRNDVELSTSGDNYWGYSTLAFFAPDRHYACDTSPGGPTREFAAMVRAMHERGIKVFLDVVYNHTAEGGVGDPDVATILSLRGLDNAGYYELSKDGHHYQDNTGVGANTNARTGIFRDLVIDSLAYLHEDLGVDGFRFDLASVLGNGCDQGCFDFDPGDPKGILQRAGKDLPARPREGGDGVDLIAEPWGIGAGTYQLGHFPKGMVGVERGIPRHRCGRDMNLLDVVDTSRRVELLFAIAGSPERISPTGPPPSASINFVVAHDGFTLRDLHSCNEKNNSQPWPYGPSRRRRGQQPLLGLRRGPGAAAAGGAHRHLLAPALRGRPDDHRGRRALPDAPVLQQQRLQPRRLHQLAGLVASRDLPRARGLRARAAPFPERAPRAAPVTTWNVARRRSTAMGWSTGPSSRTRALRRRMPTSTIRPTISLRGASTEGRRRTRRARSTWATTACPRSCRRAPAGARGGVRLVPRAGHVGLVRGQEQHPPVGAEELYDQAIYTLGRRAVVVFVERKIP